MLEALKYSALGSDFGNDMIYVAYLVFMWGTISLASYLDYRGILLPTQLTAKWPAPQR